MLYKLIENKLVEQPKWIEKDGNHISNPTDETLKALGWKEFVSAEKPVVPDGKFAVKHLEESETAISEVWELLDITTEEE